MLWTEGEKGADHQWWMTVNTKPGRGTPRDWEKMGGGYDAQGKVQLGKLPTPEEFGSGWNFNYDEVLRGGRGRDVHLQKTSGSKTWGMNWDEDEGAASSPTPTSSTCRACATTARARPAWRPAPTTPCSSAEDGLVLRDEEPARATRSARAPAPTRRSTSTKSAA